MTILIPIDFSDNSLKAVNYALKHYGDANIKLLHIVNARQAGATIVIDINSDLQKFYQKRMVKTRAELEAKYPKAKIEGKVEIGLFSETIVEEIENCNADLIVLGTKGASGVDEILLGSNAYLAIKNSTIPLLIINPTHNLEAPKKLLFASDFEGDLKDNVVQHVLNFKNKFKADMHVIHVNHSGEGNDVKLKINHLIDDVVERFHVVNDENIENAIVDFAQKEEFDFIVLAPKNRGLIRSLFHKSVTKRICASAKTALFIIK